MASIVLNFTLEENDNVENDGLISNGCIEAIDTH